MTTRALRGLLYKQVARIGKALACPKRLKLLAQARSGAIVVIDVRPRDEYDTAHLPFARSLPLAELEARPAGSPMDKDIVADCRSPFRVFADAAVQLLTARGYRVRKLHDGVSEWHAAGLPLALDRAAFVDALTRGIPPRPADMEAMVRANLGLVA